MKNVRLLILVFLLLGFVGLAFAQNFARTEQQKLTVAPADKALRIGEELSYNVELLGVPIGSIVLRVQGLEMVDGFECYHIIAQARPNRLFAKLYYVEYTVHTYIDKNTLYTRRFEKTRRTKNKVSFMAIDFDRQNKEAKYRSSGSTDTVLELSTVRKKVEDSVPVTFKIIDDTQDLFSSLYYLRLMNIEENKNYSLNIYYHQRSWKMELKTGSVVLRDTRGLGSLAVFGVTMQSSLGEFIVGKRNMLVEFSADSRRIPVEFRFGTGIGPIRGRLKEMPR